jgi:hypothetical protein
MLAEDLSDEEKDALREEEKCGFWRQSKYLRAGILMASLGGMIQGWTQSVTSGSNVQMPVDFNLHISKDDELRNIRDIWVFGLLNAILFFSAGLL